MTIKEKNEFDWRPYEEFVKKSVISYSIIERTIIEGYPLIIVEQSKTNRIAFLVIPTKEDRVLTGDLTKTNDLARNSILRLVTEAKKALSDMNMDVVLMIAQCRLVFAPKNNESKQLALNKWWIF